MKHIRAFVAHSFSEGDAVVVSAFLKYLDAISEVHPTFSWDHAERAEPKQIDEKVLRLLSEKTLFIAICTKKEQAVMPSALRRSIFLPNRYISERAAFEWKTSDWIIQEIGLAVGLGLPAIILVESGVRPPGGLLGNLEYISFSRESPEKSFPRILEMIGALSPSERAAHESAETSVLAVSPTTTEPDSDLADEAWANPTPAWGHREYRIAFMHHVVADDADGARRISDAFLASPAGLGEDDRRAWIAHCEWTRIVFDKGGSIHVLKSIANENPKNPGVAEKLARAYLHYEEYTKAADAFEQAASNTQCASETNRLLKDACIAAHRGGDDARASRVTDRMRALAQESSTGYELVIEAEYQLATLRKEDETQISALERLVEISPDDSELRFSLAYKYAELGRTNLSALHYSKIPAGLRTGATWNNLAVALDRLGMPAKAVAAYRRSEELGETLAMSNLANKLLDAGFIVEAQAICDAAVAKPDPHKNVHASLSQLKQIPEDEERKELEALEQAKPVRDFYRQFGEALSRPLPSALSVSWIGPDCPLELSQVGASVVLSGCYERAIAGLLARLTIHPTQRFGTSNPLSRFQVTYTATPRGSALIGSVSHLRDGEAPKVTLGGVLSLEQTPLVLMAVSKDGKQIRVLERADSGSPRIYEVRAT